VDMKCFPEFKDDVEFAKQLILEQGVTCLPGSVSLAYNNYTYLPIDMLIHTIPTHTHT
jgi:aspartate/methionine/tyrosine aminotransferase